MPPPGSKQAMDAGRSGSGWKPTLEGNKLYRSSYGFVTEVARVNSGRTITCTEKGIKHIQRQLQMNNHMQQGIQQELRRR